MTPDPDGLLAVAALHRCMAARDYAGAARLVPGRATLDGLTALAGFAEAAWQSAAERAYRASVAAWRAEHEASVRRRQERDVRALVALVAEAVRESRRDAGAAGWPLRQPGRAA